jgi:hypothetical protein
MLAKAACSREGITLLQAANGWIMVAENVPGMSDDASRHRMVNGRVHRDPFRGRRRRDGRKFESRSPIGTRCSAFGANFG